MEEFDFVYTYGIQIDVRNLTPGSPEDTYIHM